MSTSENAGQNSASATPPEPVHVPVADAPAPQVTAAPAVKPILARRPGQPLPPYRVFLHNDDINDMRFVVRTLVELVRMDSAAAMKVMLEAHKEGLALVVVTHKERAELFRDQFASKGLTASIEPENG